MQQETPLDNQLQVCPSCRIEFDRPAAETDYYRQRTTAPPVHCRPCRARLRAERNAGDVTVTGRAGTSSAAAARNVQQGRGQGRRGDRGPKTMFPATCVACGTQTTVPFQPRRNRPVFCRECFAQR